METCKTIKVSVVLHPNLMEPQDKILKTALSLFFKYGIKHVTMDDIAKELGMSKKTIYQFYKEKDDLVNQLCAVELRKKEEEFCSLQNASTDAIHEIILISDHMRQMLESINPVFFKDLQKFHPSAFGLYLEFRSQCGVLNVQKNIVKGKESGVYRSDLDEEFAANLRLAQIDMLIFGNYFSFEKVSFAQTHELLLEMFVYGICTLKGHKLYNQYQKIKEIE